MKSLFHFILLIIHVSTSNSSLYNSLRENVIRVLKDSIPDISKRLPRFGIAAPDPLLNKHVLRSGVEENLEDNSFDHNSPVITRGLVNDDATDSTPKQKLVKRKRKKGSAYSNDGRPVENEKNDPQILRIIFIRNQNEEEGKQQRVMKHSAPKLKPVKRKSKQIRLYGNYTDSQANKIKEAQIFKTAKISYQTEEDKKQDLKDIEEAQRKAKILRNAKHFEDRLYDVESPNSIVGALGKQIYHIDPVLNLIRSHYRRKWPYVKSFRNCDAFSDTSSTSDSSADQYDWKEEWKYYWAKQFEGLTSTLPPRDTINTFTVKPLRAYSSSEREKEKRRRKRQKAHKKHKKQMKKIIDKISKDLENKLYYQYKKSQYQKASMLKKFVKHLKKQYKKDSKSLNEIHEGQMIKTDAGLQNKLNQIRELNVNFLNNATFRDIILNGKVTKTGARMLRGFYPELVSWKDKNVALAKSSEEDEDKTWLKFLQHLKKQYKYNTTSIKDLHEEQMKQTDAAVLQNLNQIKKFFKNFLTNDIFRDIILNGKVTKTDARIRIKVHPKLESWREKKTVSPKSSEENEEDKTSMLKFLQHLKKEYEKNITSVNEKDEPFKDRVYPEMVTRQAKWQDKTVIRAKSSEEDYDVEYGYLYE